MKLIEKLTDEEVDEMIPQTDVDDTQCSEQLADVSVPQIADRIVEVVAALHGSESQNEPSHRSSTCRDTHKVVGNIVNESVSRSKLRTHRMRTSRKLSGGESVRDHQEDCAEKESDPP